MHGPPNRGRWLHEQPHNHEAQARQARTRRYAIQRWVLRMVGRSDASHVCAMAARVHHCRSGGCQLWQGSEHGV